MTWPLVVAAAAAAAYLLDRCSGGETKNAVVLKTDSNTSADAASLPDASDYSSYCKKEGGFDLYTLGQATFINESGIWASASDTCKISGIHGLLAEVNCKLYNPANPTQASLMEYVMCNCKDGVCIDDSVINCRDPGANAYIPGASVWTDAETGKTHISTCPDDDLKSVLWYLCNDKGTLYEDITPCDPGLLCGDGMCGGFICTDDEPPGTDPDGTNHGEVRLYNPTTQEEYSIGDTCFWNEEKFREYRCPIHTGTQIDSLRDYIVGNFHDEGDCPPGIQCKDGICADSPEEICIFDSDPENDTKKLGQLSILHQETGEIVKINADGCIYSDSSGILLLTNDSLWQWDCDSDGNKILAGKYYCDEGEVCDGGICTSAEAACGYTCEDTDLGLNVMIGGNLSLISKCTGDTLASDVDFCQSNHVVQELYCDGDKPKYSKEECPDEYFCVDNGYPNYGHCKKCSDIDGEVFDIMDVYGSDFCTDIGQLKQAFCDPDTGLLKWGDPEECPPDTECKAGKCK